VHDIQTTYSNKTELKLGPWYQSHQAGSNNAWMELRFHARYHRIKDRGIYRAVIIIVEYFDQVR
jgi:hypothetical protein